MLAESFNVGIDFQTALGNSEINVPPPVWGDDLIVDDSFYDS